MSAKRRSAQVTFEVTPSEILAAARFFSQVGPLDNSERFANAIKYVMEKAERDRVDAIEALATRMPEIREYRASNKRVPGTWSKPHRE